METTKATEDIVKRTFVDDFGRGGEAGSVDHRICRQYSLVIIPVSSVAVVVS